ncbi:MAG TPA: crossover junction endodeoxyribonuclease RuvC [Actinomycetota bacterium]|nr:crossover junction endodeoxyribonuclease RuvC [Actinomycetota bacterium]
MGIDPGLTRTGYAVIESSGATLTGLCIGTARAPADQSVPQQLFALCIALERVMEEYEPEAIAVERLFFNSNVRTALRVGQASGVALLAAAESGIPVFEYTPSEVKMAVTGVGNATKDQVGYMVRALVTLEEEPDSPDAADAIALAVTHANGHRMRAAIGAAEGKR